MPRRLFLRVTTQCCRPRADFGRSTSRSPTRDGPHRANWHQGAPVMAYLAAARLRVGVFAARHAHHLVGGHRYPDRTAAFGGE